MSVLSDYNKLKKKREQSEQKNTGNSVLDDYYKAKTETKANTVADDNDDIGPVTTTRSILRPVDPVSQAGAFIGAKIYDKLKNREGKDDKEDDGRRWFQKGAFEDGYQFGDVTKSILGSASDVGENLLAGAVGMGEKAVDALATVTPYLAQVQYYQNGGAFHPVEIQQEFDKQIERYKETVGEFVKKDLYDEKLVAKLILAYKHADLPNSLLGVDTETDSVFGEKSDALAQSAGQLGATMGLQAVGVPWWLTTGVTSFGSETEAALNQGATHEEAVVSGLVSAGAEILTEKIGGISFGGKTLTDTVLAPFTRSISNKAVRMLLNAGVDAVGEGAEEILSGVMSAIGQKMTYMDDKELSELFSSEEAAESFIGGFILGGGSNVIGAVKSNMEGVDAVTGLSENEQAVVDKVFKEAVAEQEQNGKKLTAREKNKLYDNTLHQLDKGYISTDAIEETLGGDAYKSYQNNLDSEKALIEQKDSLTEEFKQLNQMKQSDMTGEQIDRRAELKEEIKDLTNQINEIQNGADRSNLKAQLSSEVERMLKTDRKGQGSRLLESYNERTRRGQTFEADVTQYDTTQREVVQRAIDSGILNNTNRTHEFVDLIAKISADKGVSFDFTNNAKLKESGFALKDATVNGYITADGTVGVNINSAKALNAVVGHEITHVLEGTELYETMATAIKEYAGSKGEYETRLKQVTELYTGKEGYTGEDAQSKFEREVVADLVGDYLFTDSDFINSLSVNHRNVFEKIYDEIKYLCKVATAGSEQAKELEKVKKLFAEAYRAETKNTTREGGVRYSLSEKFHSEYDAWDGRDPTLHFEVGTTSEVLKKLGVEEKSIVWDSSKIIKIKSTHHDMTDTIIKQVPEILENPIIVMESKTRPARLTMFGEVYTADNKPILAVLELHPTKNDIAIDEIKIASAYSKDNAQNFIDSSKILYVDKNKERTDKWSQLTRLQLPVSNELIGPNDSISPLPENVNREISSLSQEELKSKQLDIILESNPANNTYSTWIRDVSDIKTFEETLQDSDWNGWEEGGFDPDYTPDMVKQALDSGNITVYSSYPIEQGIFVTPSRMEAQSYSSDGKVYSKTVALKDVAWIDPTQGQYAKVDDGTKASLSEAGADDFAPVTPAGTYSVYGKDIALEDEPAPMPEEYSTEADSPSRINFDDILSEEERQTESAPDVEESNNPKGITRKELHQGIVDNVKTAFADKGFDFDQTLKKAKNLSTFSTVDNTPQRVMEKALGYKAGGILADLTVNKVAQNETEGIKWLNSFTDRKNGLLAQISKQYKIKPGSEESAAAQMYAEGFYVADNNDIISYGDAELAKDFPDLETQANIKGLARDPRIRRIYDETLSAINESRTRNAYPEIPRIDNYYLHFRAMEDTFSKLGLPFNPNDIRAKDLPTDLNGVTADLKPGQPYFASAMHRKGKRTSFDLLGGLEKYLTSAKNQIYHIDDIQTLRALRNYVADTYGQAKGLEGLEVVSEEEAQERIRQVYGSHLSTFAKFLNEEANILAGKTSLIDRGLEGIIGRRGITFLNTVNRQVGSNMVGMNISSSLTNFLPVAQTFAKTNKADFVKAFAQTVGSKIASTFGRTNNFAKNSPVMIRRKGAERFYRTPWQKAGDIGYTLMSAVDDISTELIARTKFNEFTRKGMSEQQAHYETDKWVSRLMGDRSLGQMPQLYNSKTLGLITKFQLEVRNQLDSQFYDTVQEAKVSNEYIQNALVKNAKTAAKITSTFVQLAVTQHLFGKAFEQVAGYNPAFDIIEVLIKTFGFDDEEDSEDTALDNIEEGFLALLEDLPYTSTLTGGRIPISSALPLKEIVTGVDQYGYDKPRLETLSEIAPYYLLPAGYGQIKKTVQGLSMFSDEHPVHGSYTDSGNLRFPVEDTFLNRIQAGVFGQWASENARDYFDKGWAPIDVKKTQEYMALGLDYEEYWDYRNDISKIAKRAETEGATDEDILISKYFNSVGDELSELYNEGKMDAYNVLARERYESYKDVNIDGEYANIGDTYFKRNDDGQWFKMTDDQASKRKATTAAGDSNYATDGVNHWRYNEGAGEWRKLTDEQVAKQEVYTHALGVSAEDYWKYYEDIGNFDAKDESGETISGLKKERVRAYIDSLDIDDGAKLILFKAQGYKTSDEDNIAIVEYMDSREDISYEEMVEILTELGFTVNGSNVSW